MRDGQVNVEFADGRRIVVKNDGVTGYDFVVEYLSRMEEHYSAHLTAIDQILQRDLAGDYKTVKAVPNVYRAHLAVQSMNCVFGRCDEVLDCDAEGGFAVFYIEYKVTSVYRCFNFGPFAHFNSPLITFYKLIQVTRAKFSTLPLA